ncbi:hypothetical protein HDU93_004796, partial [Gonapodya sp. JEL0774]
SIAASAQCIIPTISKSAALLPDLVAPANFEENIITPSVGDDTASPARREALSLGPYDTQDSDAVIRYAPVSPQAVLSTPSPQTKSRPNSGVPPEATKTVPKEGILPPLPSALFSPTDITRASGTALTVKSGTLLKLVSHLFASPVPDSTYLTAFFQTYPSFVKADVLLELMVRRYEEPPPAGNATAVPEIRRRVLAVISIWISLYWKDFSESFHLLFRLKEFLAQTVSGRD